MKHYRSVIIILLVVVVWLAIEKLLQRRTVPPPSVTNFPAFINWQKSPRDIEVIHQGGADYLLAFGSSGGWLASGPSGYVFDRTGRLVDWSSDVGDDSRFQNKWIPSSQQTERHLDMKEARQWIIDGQSATKPTTRETR